MEELLPMHIYRRLDQPRQQVRLLTLHQGRSWESIKVSLRHASLPDVTIAAPPFEALSYVWGSSDRTCLVICDHAKRNVTEALHQALFYLRHETEARILWTDALCINQDDLEEKSDQIPLMRQIYRSAQRVVAWLGGPTQASSLAMNLTSSRPLQLLEPHLKVLHELFARPWFSRLWIVQEIALAKDIIVCCGEETTTWINLRDSFHELARVLYRGRSELDRLHEVEGMKTLVDMRNAITATGSVSIATAWRSIRRMNASDARDMFYGLLGLLEESIRLQIRPDYNLTTAEVFRNISRVLIASSASLRTLSMTRPVLERVALPYPELTPAFSIQRQMEDLPTWCLDWTTKDEYAKVHEHASSAMLLPLDTDEGMYAATHQHPTHLQPTADPNALHLGGRIVGAVLKCCRSFQCDAIQQAASVNPTGTLERLYLMAWVYMIVSMHAEFPPEKLYRPTGAQETNKSALVRTIVGDRWIHPFEDEQYRPAHPATETWLGHWLSLMKLDNPENRHKWSSVDWDKKMFEMSGRSDTVSASKELREQLPDLLPGRLAWKAITYTLMGRCVISVDNEYMGLAPPTAREGDTAVVLYGGRVPYILRQTRTGSQDADITPINRITTWQFVGEAYIHGLMDGEALDHDMFSDELFSLV